MPLQSTTAPSILSKTQKSPTEARSRMLALRSQGVLGANVAQALDDHQSQLDVIRAALQQAIPLPDEYKILDAQGNIVAAIGFIIGEDGKVYEGGFFKQIWIGPGDPSKAIFYSDGKSVQIGKNGWISVLDPFDGIAAWIGTQSDQPQPITAAANNGTGLVRLTVPNHNYTTGDKVDVEGSTGIPHLNGQWLIDVPLIGVPKAPDPNHFDLVGSVFAGAFGGPATVQRYFAGAAFEELAVGGGTAITDAKDNGAGLIRITAVGHDIETGWFVTVTGVTGIENVNGYWYAKKIDDDHLDLLGTEFNGAYTGGGSVFAWAAAKLRAQANGDLLITNAFIQLIGKGPTSATITLDPKRGEITIVENNSSNPSETLLDSTGIVLFSAGTAGGNATFISKNVIQLLSNVVQVSDDPPSFTFFGPELDLLPTLVALHGGTQTIQLSGVSGEISTTSHFAAQGFIGQNTTINAFGPLGLQVLFASNVVFGTPGPGQSNGAAVVNVSADILSHAVKGGIVTS